MVEGAGKVVDKLQVLDFDFTGVTHAVQDLAFMISSGFHSQQIRAEENSANKHAFLKGYLEQLGEAVDDVSIHLLLVDCELAQLGCWNHGAEMLTAWNIHDFTDQEVSDRVSVSNRFAAEVRASSDMQGQLSKYGLRGLAETLSGMRGDLP